jgi:hypothetical protein
MTYAFSESLDRDRARICRSIHRRIILESVEGRNARRETWARLVIGLPPVPRPICRTRPWRDAGISRTTFYRRRARALSVSSLETAS